MHKVEGRKCRIFLSTSGSLTKVKREKMGKGCGAHLWSQHLGGRGKRIESSRPA
jgi:hypothetical protein